MLNSRHSCFSALQRAEIAEIYNDAESDALFPSVSVLFNEPKLLKYPYTRDYIARAVGFSALQRAEIAEIRTAPSARNRYRLVSVLFNEPKLLKSCEVPHAPRRRQSFSALQRAEIAEMTISAAVSTRRVRFQCSSTSRNC